MAPQCTVQPTACPPPVAGAENALDQAAQQARRDVSGGVMLFFAFFWFVAPASASYMAIRGSTAVLDFNDRRWRIAFRSTTLTLVIVAIWLLVPWFNAMAHGFIIAKEVTVFRVIDLALNFLVGIVLIRKSVR